jgi:hypothetical protein
VILLKEQDRRLETELHEPNPGTFAGDTFSIPNAKSSIKSAIAAKLGQYANKNPCLREYTQSRALIPIRFGQLWNN